MISTTFALQMMVESYKNGFKPHKFPSNPRISSLKFAQDISRSIKRLLEDFPVPVKPGCGCQYCQPPTLYQRLGSLAKNVSDFLTEPRFDLYYQTPLVAGSQIMAMLSMVNELGLQVCNQLQLVGVALHLYNMLRQLNAIDEEKILFERLCDVTGHRIFRGPRPKAMFDTHYKAFQRGRLEIDPKTRKHRMVLSSWNPRRLDYHSLSDVAGLQKCKFLPGCQSWVSVWKRQGPGSGLEREIDATFQEIQTHPLVCALDHLEAAANQEWKGEFPVARLNWLEIYMSCFEFLEGISNANCGDPRELLDHVHTSRKESLDCGIQFVEGWFPLADDYGQHEFFIMFEKDISTVRKALRSVFRGTLPTLQPISQADLLIGKRTSDYVWNL